jgi:HD superfamily phosphohydrolase
MMEWIDTPTPLVKYLKQRCASPDAGLLFDLIQKIADGFSALAYIHSRGIIHWDIKSENFLVDKNHTIKLMDIGNARLLKDKPRTTIVLTTRGNYPPALDKFHRDIPGIDASSNRTAIELPNRSWDCPWLDMWMFAHDLIQLFREELEPFSSSVDYERGAKKNSENRVTPSERHNLLGKLSIGAQHDTDFYLQCLRLVLRRILVVSEPKANRYYSSADDVIGELRKITPQLGAAQEVRELSEHPQNVMRIPVNGNIPYTERLARVYNSAPLKRLFSHYQLGPVHQVFPGATHRRSEHTAGVLAVTCQYVRALFADRDNPFWRLAIDRSDIDSLLLAAMLHDIGHVAFGHFIEEMLGSVKGLAHEDYVQEVLAPMRTDIRHHFSKSLEAAADRSTLLDPTMSGWGAAGGLAKGLLTAAHILKPPKLRTNLNWKNWIYDKDACSQLKLLVLHTILDSAIDADKLDYLVRDAHHCGVPYARGIDKDRFFQSLTVVSSQKRKIASIGVSDKGILPVESILIARYQLFRSVYWHHTVRSLTVMMHMVIQCLITSGLTVRKSDEETMTRRLRELLAKFRSLSDEDAIRFLRKSCRSTIKDSNLRGKLIRICDALQGDRSKIYKRIFELHFDPSLKNGGKIFKSLNKWDKSMSGENTLRRFSTIQQIRTKISTELERRTDVHFDAADILIDIPPAGKDQVDDIFVILNNTVRSIHEVSSMGNAVRATFQTWTRSVRIFCAPEALQKCEREGHSRANLHNHCYEALEKYGPSLN